MNNILSYILPGKNRTTMKQRPAKKKQSFEHYSKVPTQKPCGNSGRREMKSATRKRRQTPEGPQPLRRQLPPASPFPLNAMPPVLRGVIERLLCTIQPPTALAAQSVLAASCLAVQGIADFAIDGRRSPLSEFFMTVGESGERKSATDDIALTPLRKWERSMFEEAKSVELEYLASCAAWKKGRDKALQTGESHEIKEAFLKLGGEPEPPLEPGLIIEEPTYEGLVKKFANGYPSLGLFSDEGGHFLGGHAMSSDNILKTVTGLSKLWDGKPITRTRSGDQNLMLFGRRCCIHLMMQPNVAGLLFANDMLIGQGFLPRCLLAFPESTIGNRPYRVEDLIQSVEAQRYFDRIGEIMERPLPSTKESRNELSPRDLVLTPGAKEEWIRFHNYVESNMGSEREYSSIRGFAAKAAEHAGRVAGVLTLIEDHEAEEIPLQTIQAGIALMEHYLGESLRLFNSHSDRPDLLRAEKCLTWIKAQGGLFSLPDLYQRGPRDVRNKDEAKAAINTLESHGWIERIEGGAKINGMRRLEVWKLREYSD